MSSAQCAACSAMVTRPLDRAAASEPGSVVAEEAIVICEGRLLQQRLAPGSRHAPVDQHDGLA